MSLLSFDEKDWDKVRPWTVKKTGVSEALRAFEKLMPKTVAGLSKPEECVAAAEALDTLTSKFDKALERFDKKKHEAEIKKVKLWLGEIVVRRRAIMQQVDTLHDGYDKALAETNLILDPFFEKIEEARADARMLLSNLQDEAKVAMLASAKADMDTLLKAKQYASEAKLKFDQLFNAAKDIHPQAVKAAGPKLPPEDVLDDKQKKRRATTILRASAIQAKFKDIELFREDFAEVHDMIVLAGSKGEGLEDKFLKLVQADFMTFDQMTVEVGYTKSSLEIDLDQVKGGLEGAAKKGIDPQDAAKRVEEVKKYLKDAIAKLKLFDSQVNSMARLLKSKLGDYPDFVTPENPKFKPMLVKFATVKEFVRTQTAEVKPQLSEVIRQCGERVANLLNTLQEKAKENNK